jgi:ribosome-binding protein aMBF1 (putative translation factor)
VFSNAKAKANAKVTRNANASQNVSYDDDVTKIEAPPMLRTMILNARTASGKTQKVLAGELGIAVTMLSRWETGKDVPSNTEIAKIERVLRVKMPRSKKVRNDKD